MTLPCTDMCVPVVTPVVPANASAIIVFTVTLNGPALVTGERVTAMANADYCGTGVSHLTRWGDYSSMNLTFVAGGPRAQYVTVPLHQDPVYDGEVFSLKLSNPVGAVIAKAVGVGTVVDSPALFDDPFFFDACLSKMRWGSN